MGTQVIRDGESIVKLFDQLSTESNRSTGGTEVGNTLFNNRPEMAHEPLNGPSSGVTERTNCAAFDLFATSTLK
jgi:hypothetical protein